MALTIRPDAGQSATAAPIGLVRAATGAPRVGGAHAGAGDPAASGATTAESKRRPDLRLPPAPFAMVEATDADAFTGLLPEAAMRGAGARGTLEHNIYRLGYLRTKTAFG